jgi:hypothetical protein
MHGCTKRDLYSEDLVQHRKTLRTAGAAIAVLLIICVGLVFAASQFLRQKPEAERQRALVLARSLKLESDRIAASEPAKLELSVLLGLENLKRNPTVQPDLTYLRTVNLLPTLPVYSQSLAVSAMRMISGTNILAIYGNGRVRCVDLAEKTIVKEYSWPLQGETQLSPPGTASDQARPIRGT